VIDGRGRSIVRTHQCIPFDNEATPYQLAL
jgi:hypothetical protein